MEPCDASRLGEERRRILGIQAYFDCVPDHLVTISYKGFALGDSDLALNEIEARDRFGDRVLDLDAAVQLEEEEVVALDDELDGSGAAVADRPPERDRCLVERRAECGGETGAGASSSTFW